MKDFQIEALSSPVYDQQSMQARYDKPLTRPFDKKRIWLLVLSVGPVTFAGKSFDCWVATARLFQPKKKQIKKPNSWTALERSTADAWLAELLEGVGDRDHLATRSPHGSFLQAEIKLSKEETEVLGDFDAIVEKFVKSSEI